MFVPSVGKYIRRGISDVLLVLAVALFASAAGVWMRGNDAYEVVDESSDRMQSFSASPKKENEPPYVDWDALFAVNPQVVGWISIPHTSISYPVVQADNNEFYLHRNLERQDSEGGAIFLDCENLAPGMLNQQSIIYGHHMKNGIMFKQVADFDNQEFFDSVDTVWYLTPEYTYELQPLYLMYVPGGDTTVRQFDFGSAGEFHQYLAQCLGRSVTRSSKAEVAVTSIQRILTLCTCNYIDGKGRSVLVCAEKGDVDRAVLLQGGNA